MLDVLRLLALFIRDLFRSRRTLEAEVAALRHQLAALRCKAPKRVPLTRIDRIILALLQRLDPDVLSAVHIVRPETVIHWHRMGFKALWRWKSRPRGGRPKIAKELCDLIGEMSLSNPLWGAPRIHGELKMLGIDVA